MAHMANKSRGGDVDSIVDSTISTLLPVCFVMGKNWFHPSSVSLGNTLAWGAIVVVRIPKSTSLFPAGKLWDVGRWTSVFLDSCVLRSVFHILMRMHQIGVPLG